MFINYGFLVLFTEDDMEKLTQKPKETSGSNDAYYSKRYVHYSENSHFLPFLSEQVQIVPSKRSSARELLEHPYLNESQPLEDEICRAIDTNDSIYLTHLFSTFDINNFRCLLEYRDNRISYCYPLYYSAHHNKYECVKIMVEHFDVSIGKSEALLAAAKKGNKQIMEYLVNKGGDLNIQDENGKTPLILASKRNNVEIVQFLTSDSVMADLGIKDKSGMTALHYASLRGHLPIVQHLFKVKMSFLKLAGGANTVIDPWSDRDNKDRTELHLACWHGQKDVIEFLVTEAKADLTKTASCYGNDSAWNPFHFAILSRKVECIDVLLSTGAMDVNARTKVGLTPFLIACYEGDLDTVKYLALEAKADVYVSDDTGKNALHHATSNYFYHKIKVIKYLWENYKLNASATDEEGRNPLHYAAMAIYDTMDALKYLVETCHVDICATDKDGFTAEKLAEHKAAQDAHPEYFYPKVQYLKTVRESAQD